jgi:hypothetical protein
MPSYRKFDTRDADNQTKRFQLINLEGVYIRETADAVCFEMSFKGLGNTRRVWFPKSVIWYKDDCEDFQCQKWFAEKNDLI